MPYHLEDGTLFAQRTDLIGPAVPPQGDDVTKRIAFFARQDVDKFTADFEDGLAVPLKGQYAREGVLKALSEVDFPDRIRVKGIRVNGTETEWHDGDMYHILTEGADLFQSITVPKLESAQQMADIVNIVEANTGNWSRPPQLEVLIETAKGDHNKWEIAEVLGKSGYGAALIYGMMDDASSIGATLDEATQNRDFGPTKQGIIRAAKANGLHYVDNTWLAFVKPPHPEKWDKDPVYKDAGSYEAALGQYHVANIRLQAAILDKNEQVAKWGGDGTWLTHPSSLPAAGLAYTPKSEAIKTSGAFVEKFLEAGAGGQARSGQLEDPATVAGHIALLGKAAGHGLYSVEKYLGMRSEFEKIVGNVHFHEAPYRGNMASGPKG